MINSIYSELIKIKRTALVYFCLIAAAIVPIIMFVDNLDGFAPDAGAIDSWKIFYYESMAFICFLMLPLFVVFGSTLLMQIEYRNNTWKQVLAAPQQLWQVFVAKFLVHQGMVISFLVLYNVLMIAFAVPLHFMYPDAHLLGYLDRWPELLQINALAYVSSLGVSGIQFWMAVRYRNFILPAVLGLVLWFSVLISFEFTWPFATYHPYGFSALMIIERFANLIPTRLVYSVAFAAFFLGVGYLEFAWRKVTTAG